MSSTAPSTAITAPNYGVPLVNDAWSGWRLRVGEHAARGKMEGLVAADDAVLIWTGGKSEVSLHARAEGHSGRHHFVRSGGMIDLLPKGIVFDEVSWHGQPCTCVSVPFDAARVERALGRKAEFRPDRLRTAVSDPHVVDLALRLREQAELGQPWGPLYVEALSLTLASYVYGRYGSQAEAQPSSKSLPALQSERVVEFVEDRLAQPLSLADLALLVGYSADHFSRLFRAAFGLSPYQYILERRVERAKGLLKQNQHSIAQIAVLCGFASQAHLNAAFKARTGVTPGAFRRS